MDVKKGTITSRRIFIDTKPKFVCTLCSHIPHIAIASTGGMPIGDIEIGAFMRAVAVDDSDTFMYRI